MPEYSLPQVIPSKIQVVNFFSATIKIIFSLIIIILCIYVTIYFLKRISLPQRFEGRGGLGNIFLLDTLYLAPNRVIYLIYAGKNILVVASSDKGLSLLDKIEDHSLINDILNKKKEQWEKAKPFGVYLKGMQKKEYIRGYLARYFKSLRSLFGINQD
ncbi:MAG: flagellar biosynthetic protein FliO [Candidatus Omnitrophica bacterium]|nr:flagellar biosynthetic protein FliO [Candidatus Omnitrophota bacterium]